MRALRVVAVAPSFHDHPRLVQRIEEFAVEQFIPQFCSVIPSLRQASTTPSPLPNSISMVRNCPMISSAVYRLRAMLPPFAGRNLNSRSGLVYRGQITQQAVRAKDLVQAFGYSGPTARSYLSHLKRQDLLDRIISGHVLTEKGRTRLQFFDVGGCADPTCPLCQRKTGYITCLRCAYQMPYTHARIIPKQDFLVMVRHAGVYVPGAGSLSLAKRRRN